MITEGDLLRSRTVADLSDALEDALDRRLDGYAVLSPRDTLLSEEQGVGVVTFANGVPSLAYHTVSDRGGPPALADVGAGPYRLELYELGSPLELPGAVDDLRVPPGMAAERLAGDVALADRTRRAASAAPESDADAVVAFLEDEDAIERIRANARAEATTRAEEWDFDDAL